MPPPAPPQQRDPALLDELLDVDLLEVGRLLEEPLTRQQLDAPAHALWRERLLALVDLSLQAGLRSSRAGQLARRLRAELPTATALAE